MSSVICSPLALLLLQLQAVLAVRVALLHVHDDAVRQSAPHARGVHALLRVQLRCGALRADDARCKRVIHGILRRHNNEKSDHINGINYINKFFEKFF